MPANKYLCCPRLSSHDLRDVDVELVGPMSRHLLEEVPAGVEAEEMSSIVRAAPTSEPIRNITNMKFG
eukprot:2063508-Prorocentrum_lima.AAC.1